jgi:hypothetical protein
MTRRWPGPCSIGLPKDTQPGACVTARRQDLYSVALILLGLVSSIGTAEAQVGIRSGLSQVALIARRAPEGSIQAVSPAQQAGRVGRAVEASTTVRLSANSEYELTVRGFGSSSERVWVRDVNGAFQELTGGSSITVARGSHTKGQSEREVHYRVEVGQSGELASQLPVLYEMRIKPVM